MAQKTNLLEFQAYLDRRISGQSNAYAQNLLLTIKTAYSQWLLEASDSSGVSIAGDIAQVPLTQTCFLGLINVHGKLYAVNDCDLLAGVKPDEKQRQSVTPSGSAKLILINYKYECNAALWVEGSIQLRNQNEFTSLDNDNDNDNEMKQDCDQYPVWCEGQYKDTENEIWRMITIPNLLASQRFNKIGA